MAVGSETLWLILKETQHTTVSPSVIPYLMLYVKSSQYVDPDQPVDRMRVDCLFRPSVCPSFGKIDC